MLNLSLIIEVRDETISINSGLAGGWSPVFRG